MKPSRSPDLQPRNAPTIRCVDSPGNASLGRITTAQNSGRPRAVEVRQTAHLGGPRPSGQQIQRSIRCLDDAEVPSVECGDFGDGETLCSGHDSQPSCEQIDHLGDHEHRHHGARRSRLRRHQLTRTISASSGPRTDTPTPSEAGESTQTPSSMQLISCDQRPMQNGTLSQPNQAEAGNAPYRAHCYQHGGRWHRTIRDGEPPIRSGHVIRSRGRHQSLGRDWSFSFSANERNTQNSLPSGSAITTHVTSVCPMSIRRAPRSSNRWTSACWSSGRRSR